MKFLYTTLLTLVVTVFTNSVFAANRSDSADLQPFSPTATSVFNDMQTPQTYIIPPYTEKRLIKDWFQAPVTQKSGMFNPVFLPFEYICKSGNNDVKQPMTFPCLLSFKFDFVPDNFSARHPAFIYRKTPIWNVKPDETRRVVYYITDWEATHAIGGTITQDEGGYTGEMIVIDKTGKEVVQQKYPEPVPYFTLMGQMVKTWMDYRHQPVSEGLYKELTRPMTDDMECVRLYGRSFYMGWRTNREWGVYDQILERDPNFAEVRYWYANQKGWTLNRNSRDYKQLKTEIGKALKSHLVMPALGQFDFTGCPDKTLIADCKKIVDYAADICGENTSILAKKMEISSKKLSIEELDAMLPIAEKYPCSWDFLTRLALQYRRRRCYEKSTPLFLSAVRSGFLKGTGRFDWEWGYLSRDFNTLGYPDEAIYCGLKAMQDAGKKGTYELYWYLGLAYKNRHDYKTAAQFFQLANTRKRNYGGHLMARLCVYQSGDLTLLDDPQYASRQVTGHTLETAREKVSKGLYEEALSVLSPMVKKATASPQSNLYDMEAELICSDIHCLTGNLEKAKKHAFRAWQFRPQIRDTACLLGQCWKDDPVGMKRYLKTAAFLYQDDPLWASLAVDQGISLDEKEPYENVINTYNEITSKLSSVSGEEEWGFWQQFAPFEIEFVCLYLVEEGDTDIANKAMDLYKRYQKTTRRITYERDVHTRLFSLRLNNRYSEKHAGT